jgi:hypothetical protein
MEFVGASLRSQRTWEEYFSEAEIRGYMHSSSTA